jgi:hypothetical protein
MAWGTRGRDAALFWNEDMAAGLGNADGFLSVL